MSYGQGAIATAFHLHVVQQTTANHITSKEHRTSDRTTVGHDPGGSRSHDRGPILDPIRDTRIRVLGCWCLVGGWMNGVQMECCCYGPLAIQHAIPLASIRGALPQTSEIGSKIGSKMDHFGV